MQFVKGMIVRSKKGHDKGRFYAVLALTQEQLDSDSEIRQILAAFSERAALPKEVI